MGAYTDGKHLYKPVVGETGWDANVNTNFDTLNNDTPTRASIWWDEFILTSAVPTYNWQCSAWPCGTFWYQMVPASSDIFTVTFMLGKGTYDVTYYGTQDTNRAIVDWTLDGIPIETTQDWWSAGPEGYEIKTTSSVAVTFSGRHELIATVNGHTGGDYYMKMSRVVFVPHI
jgi:hypothetical protein